MARALDVSILVRLVDRVTAPLRALQRGFERLGALASRIGVLGGAIAAISIMAPIHQAAAFEQKLRDLVVTAGQFGEAAETRIKAVKGEMFDLALQVGIVADQLADAQAQLTSSGMSDAAASKLLPIIGRVAKAASALPADVAKVTFALSDTLGVATDQMEKQLGKLVAAGKLGRFEFKDMARELPRLTSAMKNLGVTGGEAVSTLGAALQVAMFGTDSTATAANNFKNFLDKLLSPDALKNFKEMGVDMTRVMTNAAIKGINPVEAALEKITKLTGVTDRQVAQMMKSAKGRGLNDQQAADEVAKKIKAIISRSKLGEIFQDTQVQDFLVPYMLNKEKYLEFKKAIQAAGLDEMARDFQTQMAGLSTQLTIFGQILDIFKDRIGIAFGKNLPWINAGLTSLLDGVKRVDAAFPGLIDNVLTFGGGALVLITALGLLGPVFSILAAGAGVVAAAIGVILSPIGLVAAAIAAAAVLIITNWESFKGFFVEMWAGVTDAFAGAVSAISSLFSGDWSGAVAGGEALLAGLGRLGAGVSAVMADIAGRLGRWALDLLPAPLRAAGEAAGAALREGLRADGDIASGWTEAVAGGVAGVRALFAGDWSGALAGGQSLLAGLNRLGAGIGAVMADIAGRLGRWALDLLPAPLRAAGEAAGAALREGLRADGDIASGWTEAVAGGVAGVRALFAGDWSGAVAGGQAMMAGLSRMGAGVWSLLGDLGARIRDWSLARLPKEMRAGATEAAAGFAGAFRAVPEIGKGMVSSVSALFRGDWSGVAGGARQVLASVKGLGASLGRMLPGLGRAMADGAISLLPASLQAGARKAVQVVGATLSGLGRIASGIGTLFSAGLGAIFTRLSGAAEVVGALVAAGAARARAALDAVLSWFSAAGPAAFDALVGAASTAWAAITAMAMEWGRAVVEAFQALASMSDDDWRALGERLGNGVIDGGVALIDWVTDLPARLGALLGAGAAAVRDAGTDLVQRLWDGAQEKAAAWLEWAGGMPGQAAAAIAGTVSELRNAGTELVQSLWDGAQEKATAWLEWAGGMPGQAAAAIAGTVSELRNAGTELVQNLWDGAKSKFEELRTWFAGLPGRIKSAIGSIDLSGLLKMPSLPPWMGGSAAPANDNAAGSVSTPPGSDDSVATPPPVSGRPSDPPHQKQGWAPTPGRKMADAGFAPPPALSRGASAAPAIAPQEVAVGGRIVVEAAPGTNVREVQSDDRRVALVSGRGPVIGRA